MRNGKGGQHRRPDSQEQHRVSTLYPLALEWMTTSTLSGNEDQHREPTLYLLEPERTPIPMLSSNGEQNRVLTLYPLALERIPIPTLSSNVEQYRGANTIPIDTRAGNNTDEAQRFLWEMWPTLMREHNGGW